jgi:hypothetical protein
VPPAGAQPVSGSVSGTISFIGVTTLTIQTGGRQLGMINALTKSANSVAAQDLPYVWGGGHGAAGVPSTGARGGPGANGRRIGYDCSGAVAAVLAGAGLWVPGSWVPNDAGVIGGLLARGLIAPGPGLTPTEVTLYDRPGIHIFMNIDGRFFGTSDGGAGANSNGGAGWLDDTPSDATSHKFKRYHLLPSVLRDMTTYAHSYTFEIDPFSGMAEGAEIGDRISVSYAGTKSAMMLARGLEYLGAVTATGTVTAIAADSSSVTIQLPTGEPLTLATAGVPGLIVGLAVGDGVQVTYAKDASGLLVPHALTVTGAPASAS